MTFDEGSDANSFKPLHQRTIALIGLMGVGKSTVGRRLAKRLGLEFTDGDHEVERAANISVSDIFDKMGEAEFRSGEARVMRRLLDGNRIVLATGGGAVLNQETRDLLKQQAVVVWMKADLPIIVERVQRRDTRPLLRGRDPLDALTEMAQRRYPIYAEAHIEVEVASGSHTASVDAIINALKAIGALEPDA